MTSLRKLSDIQKVQHSIELLVCYNQFTGVTNGKKKNSRT
jgi:hypothetical protein